MKYIDFVTDTSDHDIDDHYCVTEHPFQVNNHELRTWADVFEDPCVPPESITNLDSLLKVSANCFDGAVNSCFKEICDCSTFQDFNATGEGGAGVHGAGLHEGRQGVKRAGRS